MKLVIEDLWSPDVNPPSSGDPADLVSFEVLVQVALSEEGAPGREVFSFTVASPDRRSRTEPGTFVSHMLVLDKFSWGDIRSRVEKVLRHTQSCASWHEVLLALAGCIRSNDHS